MYIRILKCCIFYYCSLYMMLIFSLVVEHSQNSFDLKESFPTGVNLGPLKYRDFSSVEVNSLRKLLKILPFLNTKHTIHTQNKTSTLPQSLTLLNFRMAYFLCILPICYVFCKCFKLISVFLGYCTKRCMQQTHDWFPLYSHCFLIALRLRS